MHEPDPLLDERVLAGRYRVGPLIGTGGMSRVHRATDAVLGRDVAVKVLARPAADEAETQRIRAEIDLLATLNHRALVTLFDAGNTVLDGTSVTYLVMELVDGPTLGHRMDSAALAADDVDRMAQDLAEALVVVHAHGVVHRDIKPANILLAPTLVPGREFDAKLADFGIASLVDGARLTATGTVLGTAAYLSPEQATGTRVGPASDIYSLGLVLLEALTGRREFPGTMLESLGARLARDPVVPGDIGYEWKSLLTAMTARDPDVRPSATEVLERLTIRPATPTAADAGATGAIVPLDPTAVLGAQLEPAADQPTTVQPVAAAPAIRRRRRWAIAGGLSAAAALAIAVPVALQLGPASDPPADSAVVETAPKAPTAPLAEAPAPPPAPAPAIQEPAPAPAPVSVPTTENGDGSSNGNSGNGSGGNSGNGSDSGSNSGNGGSGNGNGGSGNGNGNGP